MDEKILYDPVPTNDIRDETRARPMIEVTMVEEQGTLEELIRKDVPNMDEVDIKKIREIMINTLQFRDGPEIEAIDELEDVVTHPDHPEQKIHVGLQLPANERAKVINLLRNNPDVFV